MITKSPQYVRETAAGKAISAWAVLYTGRHAGDVAAKVSAHYSNARVRVNVEDVEGFKSATGDRLEHALSYLIVDGVRLFDNCTKPADGEKWLKKSAAIYKRYQLPELPDLNVEQGDMSWAEYQVARRAAVTPEYIAASSEIFRLKALRTKAMTKLYDQVASLGMQFANGSDKGPREIYYISGLDRLVSMGYKLTQII